MTMAGEERRVAIVGGKHVAGTGNSVLLPDPRTGAPKCFVITDNALLAVERHKPCQCLSWFAGNRVIGDGALFLMLEYDVLFLALPLLDKARQQAHDRQGRFCSLEQVLECDGFPEARQLAKLLQRCAARLCDEKATDGESYFRLNDRRVLAWLECKLAGVQTALQQLPASPLSGMDPGAALAYSAGVLGDFLPHPWLDRLSRHLSIQPGDGVASTGSGGSDKAGLSSANAEPTRTEEGDTAAAKERLAAIDGALASKRKLEMSRQQAKAARLAKEAQGSKKINSFFAKKV